MVSRNPSADDSPPKRPMMPRSNYAARLATYADQLVFVDGAAQADIRGRWADRFRERIGPPFDGRIIFEIGCADGALLTSIAAAHPNAGFVGLDWKYKAIFDAAQRVDSNALPNLLLIRGRAQDIRSWFADREVDEIWIFHPDPCDRDVDRPNRLVSDSFLTDAFEVLARRGSLICLKTDHAEYYESVLHLFEGDTASAARRFEVAARSGHFWTDQDVQRHAAARAFAGHATFYEEKFRRKRKPIYYLELAKR